MSKGPKLHGRASLMGYKPRAHFHAVSIRTTSVKSLIYEHNTQIMYRFILIHINKFDLFRKQDDTALIT